MLNIPYTLQQQWDIVVAKDPYTAFGEDGPETAYAFSLVATNERGDRFHHQHVFTTEEHGWNSAETRANRLLARVEEAASNTSWTPSNNPYWHEGQPVYGSEAYIDGDCEGDALAMEMRSELEMEARLNGVYAPHF